MPEHQPVAAGGAHRLAFLQEAAERRHTRPRPDHDHRTRGIGRQAEMRVRPQEHLQRLPRRVPFGHVHRGNALPLPPMRAVAQRGNQQIGLLANRLAAGGDRVIPWRQRTQQRGQLLRRQFLRGGLQEIHHLQWRGVQQVDHLPAGGPLGAVRPRAGDLGECVDLLGGQRGDIQPFQQRGPQLAVTAEPARGQHRVHQRGIVVRHHTQRIAGLVSDARTLQRDFQVPGVRRRTAAGQPHFLGDVRLEGPRPRRSLGGTRKIDVDDRGAGFGLDRRRGQLFQRAVDPARGRGLVIQVALDAVGDPCATQRRQPFVEAAAGLAELRIGAVAQAQHGVAHRVEAGRVVGEQSVVEIDGALRRVALAPGAGDHQQVLGRRGLRRGHVGHVHHLGGKAQTRGGLAGLRRQRLGVAGFGAEQDRQRHLAGRRRGWSRLRRVGCLQASQETRQPGPLFGGGHRDDAVQRGNMLLLERRSFRQQRGNGHSRSFSPVVGLYRYERSWGQSAASRPAAAAARPRVR